VELMYRNLSTVTWRAGTIALAPASQSSQGSELCDRSQWESCARVVTLDHDVAPGAVATFRVSLGAPTDLRPVRECFGLVTTHGEPVWAGGPANDGTTNAQICQTIDIESREINSVQHDTGVDTATVMPEPGMACSVSRTTGHRGPEGGRAAIAAAAAMLGLAMRRRKRRA
jgi:hypothetical protein